MDNFGNLLKIRKMDLGKNLYTGCGKIIFKVFCLIKSTLNYHKKLKTMTISS